MRRRRCVAARATRRKLRLAACRESPIVHFLPAADGAARAFTYRGWIIHEEPRPRDSGHPFFRVDDDARTHRFVRLRDALRHIDDRIATPEAPTPVMASAR